MRMRSSTGSRLVLKVSLIIYRRILALGSHEFDAYKEPALQVFREYCEEALAYKGIRGVLELWPALFYEALHDMLAERFSTERIQGLHRTLRRSMILTFGAFVLFSLAYLCLMRILDPLPPFEVVSRHHPGLSWSYTLFHFGAVGVGLSIIGTGMILFVSAIIKAVRQNIQAMKKLVVGILLIPVLLCLGGVLLTHLPRAIEIDWRTQLAVVFFGLLGLIGEVRLVFRMIKDYPFSSEELQFVLGPMVIADVSMALTWLATLFWTVRLGVDEPHFAESQGLDFAHFSLNLGGSAGMVVVLFLMLLAIVLVFAALVQTLRARPLAFAG